MSTTTLNRECVIRAENIAKQFGQHRVLDGISFNLHKGETLVILGRSGTGKSVTLKSVIGLLDPDEGLITVLNKNLNALPEDQRLIERRNVGYVFQDAALFDSLTVAENVGFPLHQERLDEEFIENQVRDRLRMVGLEHSYSKFPSELSGGMRKRVGLARAIIRLPPIMLYDEPTSGLDPLTTDVINQIILRLRSEHKTSSIVVTHDMNSAFTIADRIIMLDKGRVIINGTPQEIQQSDNPWIQHFIAGQALDSERIDTGIFGGGLTRRVLADESGSGIRAGRKTLRRTIRQRNSGPLATPNTNKPKTEAVQNSAYDDDDEDEGLESSLIPSVWAPDESKSSGRNPVIKKPKTEAIEQKSDNSNNELKEGPESDIEIEFDSDNPKNSE